MVVVASQSEGRQSSVGGVGLDALAQRGDGPERLMQAGRPDDEVEEQIARSRARRPGGR
jgi:hypothetical protein